MASWTFYLDISGRLCREDSTNPIITVAGIAIRDSEIDNIRLQIGENISKWRDASCESADIIFNILCKNRFPVVIYQSLRDSKKSKECWEKFWNTGRQYHRTSTSISKQKIGFIKAANVYKYFLFTACEARLTALIIKMRGSPTIYGADGREIIKLSFVLDTDIQGEANQAQFKNNLLRWQEETKLKTVFNISPSIDSIIFSTEQEEPILLLPDYIAGCFQWSNLQPTNRLKKDSIVNLQECCKSEMGQYFIFYKEEFNIEYPLSFPEEL